MAEFPALARAKQRFLARRALATAAPPARTPEPPPGVAGDALARKKLRGLFDDLDAELSALSRDVDAIHTEVACAHREAALELDAITASFVLRGSTGSGTVAAPQEQDDDNDDVLDTPAPQVTTSTSDATLHDTRLATPSRQLVAPPRSRVASLALCAVHALVLQRFVRRFLFSRLYPSGEPQFTCAQQLRTRATSSRAWRRWRSLVVHRERSRATFAAAVQRMSADRAHSASVAAAERVRECDGKFAVAKRFHETKLLWCVVRGWLLAMAAAPTARTN